MQTTASPADDARAAQAILRAYPVLYVDDEAPNLDVFEASFGDDFRVLLAGSADEALRVMERGPVAVVISDNRMPERLGVDLLADVHRRHPETHRVLCTAYSDQQTAIDAINRAAVEHYLLKPWRKADVERLLRDLIARSHLDRTARDLRASLVQREREAAVAALRRRIEHDLGNVVSVLHGVAHGLRAAVQSAGNLPLAEAAELAEDLQLAIGRLATLQRGSRDASRVHALEASEVVAAELFDIVARLASEDLRGRGRVRYDGGDGAVFWVDRLGAVKVLLRVIAWLARADERFSEIGLSVGPRAGDARVIRLLTSPPVGRRRMEAALDAALAFDGGAASDLAVAAELATAIQAALIVGGTAEAGVIDIALAVAEES